VNKHEEAQPLFGYCDQCMMRCEQPAIFVCTMRGYHFCSMKCLLTWAREQQKTSR
jgi:hypothetical protein